MFKVTLITLLPHFDSYFKFQQVVYVPRCPEMLPCNWLIRYLHKGAVNKVVSECI